MQVSLETTSGLERRMTIVVPAEQVESKVMERLKETAKRVRIDGFRPGKVPLSVVKRRYGKATRHEVVGDVMQASFVEAIQQQSLNPAGMPSVEPTKMEPGEDFEFVATFEVYPAIELASLADIKVEKPVAEVTEADLDKMLENLREQNKVWKEVDRQAASGDQVTIDFVGKIDGEVFDGGSAENHELELGSGSMIPGFEEQVEGIKAGEEKTIQVTFPEDYQAEQLAGKSAEFDITAKKVAESVQPELDDELFAKFGVTEGGLEKFREEVQKNMERELRHAIKTKVKNQAMDALLEANQVDVPKALVDGEIDRLREQAVQQFGGNQQIDPKNLPAELFKDQAEKRVKLGLLVGELVKANNIEVDEDKVRETIEDVASAYQEPEQVVNWYYGNEQQLNEVRSLVLEDQVVDTILKEAEVTEVSCGYEEAIKPAQAKEDTAEKESEANTEDGAEEA
ncbi:trigger factor [Spartinivicinus poritis]|uniref:Trigger factor n=1 Tax=Spartinivicinus poritis TaxID=2994640 RepID=A0ABT5U3Z4_9GAMM|nr:trigger factor [Spartinivicinus sp. A2-2]MDE1461095.1 trigger factor [Spartinivicinus sp. A2-2]